MILGQCQRQQESRIYRQYRFRSPTARLANPRNLRDNNNLPSMSGRQSGKDSVQLC